MQHNALRPGLPAPSEVLCMQHPAQAESHFAEGEPEALRLGESFEATPQKKDGKAEVPTQAYVLWGPLYDSPKVSLQTLRLAS